MLFYLILFLLSICGALYGLFNAIHHIKNHKNYAFSSIIASFFLMLLLGIPFFIFVFFP